MIRIPPIDPLAPKLRLVRFCPVCSKGFRTHYGFRMHSPVCVARYIARRDSLMRSL